MESSQNQEEIALENVVVEHSQNGSRRSATAVRALLPVWRSDLDVALVELDESLPFSGKFFTFPKETNIDDLLEHQFQQERRVPWLCSWIWSYGNMSRGGQEQRRANCVAMF
jgi:hypothetical protein